VILIVVLGLLTMMALALLTYVLVAAQAKRTARASAYVERRGDPPQALLHQAALQVIRGTNEPTSVLGPHSLLEDMYGNDGIVRQIPSTAVEGFDGYLSTGALPNSVGSIQKAGTMLAFEVQLVGPDGVPGALGVDDDGDGSMDTAADAGEVGFGDDFSPTPEFYTGRVLTMIDGPAAGQSTRILTYRVLFPTPANAMTWRAEIRMLPFNSMQAASATEWNVRGAPRPGDRFVINGRPFNGTGFGLDPNNIAGNAPLNASGTNNRQFALLPNPVFFERQNTADPYFDRDYAFWRGTSSPADPAGPGGADEDYDAVDYQNMLLALKVVPAAGMPPEVLIPSLHRPELVDHWAKRLGGGAWSGVSTDLQRKVILRPETTSDHPNFTGSNSGPFDPITGPWDVDNDGDGTPDSIWVDLGMPVQTAPNGRKYKPLFAILCLDMDGKLNLNAHGNLTHLLQTSPAAVVGPYADASGAANLNRGQGYGVAEINPGGALLTDYQNILRGNGVLPGRYGETHLGVNASSGVTPAYPALNFNPDWQSVVNTFDYPGIAPAPATTWNNDDFFPYTTTTTSAYGTPPDLNGNGVIGVDLRGNPYWPADTTQTNMGEPLERAESPYKLDLSWAARDRQYPEAGGTLATVDTPFTPTEFERILRRNDIDASALPDRLQQLGNVAFETDINAATRRNIVTTESWDLPSPNMSAVPDDLLTTNADGDPTIYEYSYLPLPATATPNGFNMPAGLHISSVLRARLDRATTPGQFDPTRLTAAFKSLLAPELLAGLKLDLNRPLGNGLDDNGNGVVDEPQEAATERYLANMFSGMDPSGTDVSALGLAFDHDNNGTIDAADARARQQLAKHLYILLWMFADNDWVTNRIANGATQADLARHFAQIAVNIVDFRDADSIMTPFEYDVFPFRDDNGDANSDPWDVDGILGLASGDDSSSSSSVDGANYRGVVWGTERPELLITETLAFHDHRTEDHMEHGLSTDTTPDTTWDQAKRPESGFYVEIYNPGGYSDRPAREFNTTTTNASIDLGKIVTSPTWRLLVQHRIGADFEDPDDPNAPSDFGAERAIYFDRSGTPATIADGTNKSHYAAASYPAAPATPFMIPPGGYAVIGTGSTDAVDPDAVINVGRRTSPTRRQISLLPNPTWAPMSGATNVVDDPPAYPSGVTAPVRIVIDRDSSSQQRLSISEPLDGTTSYDLLATAQGSTWDVLGGQYDPPLDQGLDLQRTDGAEFDAVKQLGTTEAFRQVHLQRLANPLLPWNPEYGKPGHNASIEVNPFLTVDTMPVDLTVYNGDEDVRDMNPLLTDAPLANRFSSRRRDGSTGIKNIWTQSFADLTAATRTDPISDNTLGYLNSQANELGAIVSAATGLGPMYNVYYGASDITPPWMHWPNRPFVSQFEILNTPTVRSSQLLKLHGVGAGAQPAYAPNAATPVEAPFVAGQQFPHLAAFFAASETATPQPNLYRVFEYLHVPSRFAGTEEILPPANALAALSLSGDGDDSHAFHPPFNRVSRYREPGRVNVNTIFEEEVWDAIRRGDPLLPTWQKLVESRRGYGIGNIVTLPDTAIAPAFPSPTVFANPFRSFGGSYLVPLSSVDCPPLHRDREIDATFMRPDNLASPDDPLFAQPNILPNTNTDKNSYFRYLGLQKLGNTVTTRSNVYAVWITVGYFEVEEIAMQPRFPDGYQLGAELGSDTGNIQRHRAFYMIDRSIPVAFERGHDHNVEDCILIKRFIE